MTFRIIGEIASTLVKATITRRESKENVARAERLCHNKAAPGSATNAAEGLTETTTYHGDRQ